MSGALSHSGLPNSEARVALAYREVGRRVQRELPPVLAVFLRGLARRLQDIVWNSTNPRFVDHDRICVRGIQQIFRKLRRKPGELFLNRGIAALLVRGQLGAAQAEVAQGILDNLLPRRAKRGKLARLVQRLVFLEQRLVLAELGPVLRDLRQVGVVGLAQRRVVHHRVQVRHLAPGAADALVCVLERPDEIVPVGFRAQRGGGGGAAIGEQLLDRGRYVLGLDLLELRKTGKIKKRILLRQH